MRNRNANRSQFVSAVVLWPSATIKTPGNMDSGSRISRKVVLIGKDSVGKTSLMRQWLDMGLEETESVESIGLRIFKLTLSVEERSLELMIWDIEQMEVLRSLAHYYLFGAHALIFISALNDPDTYLDWKAQQAHFLPWAPKAIPVWVANKSDLLTPEEREAALANYPLVPQVSCSAKSKEGFTQLSELLLTQLMPES